ncbi:Uncharacterised protein [Nocardia cyriacigeorgica]|uniref:Uncharacterized protein n=1 Tax=Nocardia cyriacigeorgica TaxID=135487 RepID=A0A4U8VT74_9NOCA|nr:Uncharacterised protein [Nocardia cyriacigeorgica]
MRALDGPGLYGLVRLRSTARSMTDDQTGESRVIAMDQSLRTEQRGDGTWRAWYVDSEWMADGFSKQEAVAAAQRLRRGDSGA